MKFGVLQFFSWPGKRIPLAQVYERAFQRVDVMERTGYDAVWLAEHHFSTYSVCPSIHMMGTHIAARTERLRIGTAVSLAPFYHPLRLAEEVALLDVLSDGRVNWGAGRGFDPTEHRCFGVGRDDSYPRFRENIDIVLQAWQNERLTYRGQFHQFEDVEVLPKPVQQPHPPVWLASTSPDAVAWSAQNGFTILMDPHSSHADIATKRRTWMIGVAARTMLVLGLVLAFASGHALYTTGAITIGTAYLFVHYAALISRPVREITEQVEGLQSVGASIERLEELLQTPSRVAEGAGVPIPSGALDLAFVGVSFGYRREEDVLRDLSFRVGLNLLDQSLIQNAPPDQVALIPRDRIELLPFPDFLLRAVLGRVVGGRVGGQPIGDRFDHRGASAASGSFQRFLRPHEDGQHVVAVKLQSVETVGQCLLSQRFRGGLFLAGQRDRPVIVLHHK